MGPLRYYFSGDSVRSKNQRFPHLRPSGGAAFGVEDMAPIGGEYAKGWKNQEGERGLHFSLA